MWSSYNDIWLWHIITKMFWIRSLSWEFSARSFLFVFYSCIRLTNYGQSHCANKKRLVHKRFGQCFLLILKTGIQVKWIDWPEIHQVQWGAMQAGVRMSTSCIKGTGWNWESAIAIHWLWKTECTWDSSMPTLFRYRANPWMEEIYLLLNQPNSNLK